MTYQERLQTFVEKLNEDSDTFDFRVKEARKYDYIQKRIGEDRNWRTSFAIVKDLSSAVSIGYTKVKVGDLVETQNGRPQRGSAKATIMTEDENLLDGIWRGDLPNWKTDNYKQLLENREHNGMDV
jgi:uncharacterized protein YkvS